MCLIWHQPCRKSGARPAAAETQELEARHESPTAFKTRHADPKHFAEIRLLGPLAVVAGAGEVSSKKDGIGSSASKGSEQRRAALLELLLVCGAVHPDRCPVVTCTRPPGQCSR